MLRAAILLVFSNIFMTFAWYGHLRHVDRALWLVILVSWGIAFFEYCLQVPANRIGYQTGMTGAELKTLQEVITLAVFVIFAAWYLKEPIRWNTVAGFLFIALGATLIFAPWSRRTADASPAAAAAAEVGGGSGTVPAAALDPRANAPAEMTRGAGSTERAAARDARTDADARPGQPREER